MSMETKQFKPCETTGESLAYEAGGVLYFSKWKLATLHFTENQTVCQKINAH